jgi:peptidoglycan hydrolase-like protein with peptidoglycan-binding domain
VTLGVAGTKLSTDGSGRLELEVPPGVGSGEVVLDGTGTTLHGVTIPFTISALPPESTILGQEARLNNLGYRAGTTADPTSPEFRSAVEEFQCDEGLTVDGKCGPVTQAKLRSVHGS